MIKLLPILALPTLLTAAEPDPQHSLWYQQPGENWMMDALPLGNGSLGAMSTGQVAVENITLNEDSLWVGDEQDAGAYQGLAHLRVWMHPQQGIHLDVDTPSHPADGMFQGEITRAFDGDLSNSWEIPNHGGKPVIADIQVSGKATPLTEYSLERVLDNRPRYPVSWQLLGSQDGKTWSPLDEQRNVPWGPQESLISFSIENPTAYAHYRFIFEPLSKESKGVFALREIKTNLAAAKPLDFSNYRRELDLKTATQSISYQSGDTHYHRETFVSAPAQVIALRYTADKPGAHTGFIELRDLHDALTKAEGNNTLIAAGDLNGWQFPKTYRDENFKSRVYLDYETQVKVLNQGGQVTTQDGKLYFKDCDSLTILVAAATDFIPDRSQSWKGPHPHEKLNGILKAAAATPYADLKSAHLKDYQKLYDRMAIDLPVSENSKLPTDQRLAAYQKDKNDHAFEALVYHYGRYLLMGSSRPGGMPANLQGIWLDDIKPDWRGDIHADVNIQMNYWFADQANLSECFSPLADYLWWTREVRKENTKSHYGDDTPGWAMRSENGIFGGGGYIWSHGDAAWLMNNLWHHYAFTHDQSYLKDRAYPLMKDVCAFWQDQLIEEEDGTLISPESVSPEHGGKHSGNSYEMQLVHDLFTNTIAASEALDVDAELRAKLTDMRSRLLKPQIGKWGQLQEWRQDLDDPNNTHRHVAHMIAIYPGSQIAPSTTPELAQATRISLDARGDNSTSWGGAWRVALWGRLGDGNRAYSILSTYLLSHAKKTAIIMNEAGGFYSNLLSAHPPFQIDGNFGYAAGVNELLLQSHLSELHLLPSLPDAWKNGKVTGMKTRGNYTVDLTWENGELKSAHITAPARTKGQYPPIRINGHLIESPTKDPRLTLH